MLVFFHSSQDTTMIYQMQQNVLPVLRVISRIAKDSCRVKLVLLIRNAGMDCHYSMEITSHTF